MNVGLWGIWGTIVRFEGRGRTSEVARGRLWGSSGGLVILEQAEEMLEQELEQLTRTSEAVQTSGGIEDGFRTTMTMM